MDPLEAYLSSKQQTPSDPLAAYLAKRETQDDRPEWLSKNPLVSAARAKGHSLDPLLADIQRGKEALPSNGDLALRAASAGATSLGDTLNAVSLGGYKALRNGIVSLASPAAAAEATRAEDELHNDLNASGIGGQILGGLPSAVGYMAGAPEKIAHGVSAGVGRLAEAAPGFLGRMLGRRPVAGALTGAVTGAATTAAQGVTEGEDLDTALRSAKDSAKVGALIGGGAGVFAGAANKVNQSRGAQARRFIEEHGEGADVGVMSPGRGGVFDAELAGLPANDKGIGAAAKIGADKLIAGIDAEFAAETKKPYQVIKALVDNSPEAMKPRDVAPIVTKMQDAVHDLGTAPHVRAALSEQLKILESYRDPATEAVMLPENQLNALRRTLARSAKVGASDVAGEKEAPIRAAYATAKAMVDEGPYAALNEFYSEGASKRQADRVSLGLKKKAPSDRGVDVRKAKLSLTRAGQNTATAGGDADVEGFKAANPELARYADLPELQRAKADLSFRLMPQHGGLIPRMAGAALGPGVAMGALAAGSGGAGLAVAPAIMALQNATPIAGRVLYPLTRGVDTSSPGRVVGRGGQLTVAAEKKRKRDAALAASLSGGMR